MPGGDMLPYMSGRMRTQQIDALFYAAGGFDRALAWIEKSDANFGDFFLKVWAKGAIRPQAQEPGAVSGTLEDLLARLDAGEHAKVVEGTVVEQSS